MMNWSTAFGLLFSLGIPSMATAAEQDKVPSPVVIATDTYVRPVAKYAKHVYGDISGLASATFVAVDLQPMAVRFVGRHDRTYIVFGDRRCHPAIVFYDHRTKQWSKPRRIGETGAVDDAHGLPTLAIDGKGYLHVPYGSHGGRQYLLRSSAPEDISKWEPPVVVAPTATYSIAYFVGETFYLFHREGSAGWGFRTSRDGGKTWSDFQFVCGRFRTEAFSGTFYPGVWPGNEKPVPKLHLFSIYYGAHGPKRHPKGSWEDMVYAVSPDLGKTWHKADGQRIGEKLDYGQADLVYKGDTHGWPQQIVIDPSGRPGLIFGTGGPAIVDKNAAMFAYLDGTQWKVSKICDVASRYCQCAVVVRGPDHYRAYVPNGNWNGGEIFEFETTDGGRTWKHARDITQNSPTPNAAPRIVVNGLPKLQLIWCSGNRNVKGNVYAWGEVGGLPEQPAPVIQKKE